MIENYIHDKEFQSRICNIRCELEELAQYARKRWEQDDLFIPSCEEMSWDDVSNELQDFADAIAQNFEITED